MRIQVLAPSNRPVQVTENLANFWRETYPKLKPELQRNIRSMNGVERLGYLRKNLRRQARRLRFIDHSNFYIFCRFRTGRARYVQLCFRRSLV